MNVQEAFDALTIEPGTDPEAILRAYHGRRKELERQIAEAPTGTMKEKRRFALNDLETALQTLRDAKIVDDEAAATEPAGKAKAAGRAKVLPADPLEGLRGGDGSTTGQGKKPGVAELLQNPWILAAAAVFVALIVLILSSHTKGGPGDDPHAGASASPAATAAPTAAPGAPANVASLLREAAGKLVGGDNFGAINLYKKVLETDPTNATALDQLGRLAPTRGRVQVASNPPGALAQVVAAGAQPNAYGEKPTPALFDDLPFGEYKVYIRQTGYDAVNPSAVQITGTTTQQVGFELKRQTGTLTLNSEPSGQEYDVRLTKTPAEEEKFAPVERKGRTNSELTNLPTGHYEITFQAGGQRREVDIGAGGHFEITMLVPATPPATAPSANSAPATHVAVNPPSAAAASPETPDESAPAPAAGPVAVRVQTNKASYRDGEAVACALVPPFSGHLRLYSIDAKGEGTQIFPNKFEPDDRVTEGKTVRVPGNATYQLTLGLPAGLTQGTETVQAVLSHEPFDASAQSDYSKAEFVELGAVNVEALKSRGVTPRSKSALGQSSYHVAR